MNENTEAGQKRKSVMYKILSGFSIVIALTLVISFIGLHGLKRTTQNLHSLIDQQVAAEASIKMCRIEINNAARAIRDMYISPVAADRETYRKTANDSISALQGYLNTLEQSYQGDQADVLNYKTKINEWISTGSQIMDEISAGRDSNAQRMLLEECTPKLAEIVTVARQLDDACAASMSEAEQKSLNTTNVSSWILLTLVVLSAVIAVIITFWLTKYIVFPLREVAHAADEMAAGKISTKLTFEREDEIGHVADSVRASMETLNGYITDIDRAMELMASGDFHTTVTKPFIGDFANIQKSIHDFTLTMSRTLIEIEQTADQVTSGAEQVASGAQMLSQGATEQASAVEELAATINEISGQIEQNAENSNEATLLAGQVGHEVQDSNARMQKMLAAMHEISSSSSEISKIIKTIEDIAFQTNILALNAAVEAARAGAAGKGFAVVADEVRNLANKSQEASKNTSALIEASLSAVQNGTQIADETAGALDRVVQGVGKVTDTIARISAASDEQANAARQVSQGIDQISAVVQTNSATAEQSAAASEELSGQAQILRQSLSRFHPRRDEA